MKNFKSVLSLILAFAVIFSCFAVIAADGDNGSAEREIVTDFSDVDGSTAVGQAIIDLAIRGVINGRPDGTFGPDDNITRAEFSAIIVRLENLADGIGDDAVTGFADLDADDTFKWARPYIKVAKDRGLMNGYSDGSFGAGDPVTYEQVIAVLMRMHGWGPVCDAEAAATNDTWSSAYLKYANNEGMTRNAMNGLANPAGASTRGTVAVLANNSRSLVNIEAVPDGKGGVKYQKEGATTGTTPSSGNTGKTTGSNNSSDNDDGIVSGTVTATYLAYIEEPKYELNKNEIMVGKTIYMMDRNTLNSVDLFDLLGKQVKMVYDERSDIVTHITVSNYSSTDIYSGYVGDNCKFYLGVDGSRILYSNNPDTFRISSINISGEVIFNGRNAEDFRVADLDDPDSPYYFTNGVIQIVDTGKYSFTKINNYKNYVVKGTTTSRNIDYVNVMYHTGEDSRIELPGSNDANYFVFRRGKTAVSSKSDLRKFDVLSILESPEDLGSPTVKVVEVSRNSLTNQKVSKINEEDDTMFMINGRYYQYDYDYANVPDDSPDDVPELQRGSTGVSLYLDHIGQIAAVATSSSDDNGSYVYGYLLSVLQNDSDSDYNLELYIMDFNGTKREYGTSASIQIDGKRYTTSDKDIANILRDTALEAAESYMNTSSGNNVRNLEYQQPIRYKLNSSNLVTGIDTVAKSSIDGNDLVISARIDDSAADDGLRTYNRSSGFPYIDEFGDEKHFILSTTTKILFIPDNRNSFDDYGKRTTSTFTSGNGYYVEAFNVGTTASNRADLVLIYKQDDTMVYNYKSPFLIVSDYGPDDDDRETITGYRGNNNGGGTVDTTPNTKLILNYSKLSREDKEIYENLGKGDIIRYLVDSDGRVSDLELWLDASNPAQNEPVDSVSEALENRVLAIRSNSNDPVTGDAYNAAFRLAYGTVLRHETDIKSITVTPTIADDNIDMVDSGTGVVAHMYGNNTRVFVYSGARIGAEYVSGSDAFDMLQSYEAMGDGSVVVTYTTGDSTNSASPFRMIYIIH